MKRKDEIVEEVRATREAYAAQFDYELKRMFEDLKAKEVRTSARLTRLQPSKRHPLLLLEPKVLRTIGEESKGKGTDRITSPQIDRIIKAARAKKKR